MAARAETAGSEAVGMQWPPLLSGDYESLRGFQFRCERVWDDVAAVSDAAVSKAMLLGDIHNNQRS